MPIRNLWSLESGEVVTAETILENVKDSEVIFHFMILVLIYSLSRETSMFQFKLRKADTTQLESGKELEDTVGTVYMRRSF